MLHIWRLMNILHVLDNLILIVRAQLDCLHSRICHVDLRLENRIFFVKTRHKRRHVSKNVTDKNGAQNDHRSGQNHLNRRDWRRLITHNQECGVVKTYKVLFGKTDLKKGRKLGVEVFWRNPSFIFSIDEQKPDTADPMH